MKENMVCQLHRVDRSFLVESLFVQLNQAWIWTQRLKNIKFSVLDCWKEWKIKETTEVKIMG